MIAAQAPSGFLLRLLLGHAVLDCLEITDTLACFPLH